jgi:peptidoglycan/LPS O-acetylase OafA/YrhL
MNNNSIKYFDKIDTYRFFSAMSVVLYHAYNDWYGSRKLPDLFLTDDRSGLNFFGKAVDTFFKNGGFGVEVFFIISGFLITTLLLKEKDIYGRINFASFYIRRSLRIWPLYFFIIVIAPFLIKFISQTYEPNYTANIFFYNNFDTAQNHYWIFPLAHFWSLCIEEHFYLVWPFLIAFIPNKHLIKVFASLIVFSIVFRFYMFSSHTESWYQLYLNTFSRFDTLVIGSAVAFYHFSNPIKLTLSKFTRVTIYFILFGAFFFDNIFKWDDLFEACLKKYFYSLLTLFMFLNFLFNETSVFGFLSNRYLNYLGKVSYGIYVYGLIILQILMHKVIIPLGIDNFPLYMAIVIASSTLIPIISYELFEKQALKLKKKFIRINIVNS